MPDDAPGKLDNDAGRPAERPGAETGPPAFPRADHRDSDTYLSHPGRGAWPPPGHLVAHQRTEQPASTVGGVIQTARSLDNAVADPDLAALRDDPRSPVPVSA